MTDTDLLDRAWRDGLRDLALLEDASGATARVERRMARRRSRRVAAYSGALVMSVVVACGLALTLILNPDDQGVVTPLASTSPSRPPTTVPVEPQVVVISLTDAGVTLTPSEIVAGPVRFDFRTEAAGISPNPYPVRISEGLDRAMPADVAWGSPEPIELRVLGEHTVSVGSFGSASLRVVAPSVAGADDDSVEIVIADGHVTFGGPAGELGAVLRGGLSSPCRSGRLPWTSVGDGVVDVTIDNRDRVERLLAIGDVEIEVDGGERVREEVDLESGVHYVYDALTKNDVSGACYMIPSAQALVVVP